MAISIGLYGLGSYNRIKEKLYMSIYKDGLFVNIGKGSLGFVTVLILMIWGVSCDSGRTKVETQKTIWINNAFSSLENNLYPKVKAISWWNENFDKSLLKVDSSPESLEAYKSAVRSSSFVSSPVFIDNKLTVPQKGIYHAAFPDFGGTEDKVVASSIWDFEILVGKPITWAYFSNNWYDEISFPSIEVEIIRNTGKVPFIRMMPRSNFEEGGPDARYTMQRIIEGEFDQELKKWAIDASLTNIPLLVEFGTEVNGNWFPWNAQFNGKDAKVGYGDPELYDGAERFRDAYRHIIDICNENAAYNITWFFHIDAYSEPDEEWNQMELYYPGDNYIDWLGLSIYGPQEEHEDFQLFSQIMDDVYPEIVQLSDKPIAILEFAITEIK